MGYPVREFRDRRVRWVRKAAREPGSGRTASAAMVRALGAGTRGPSEDRSRGRPAKP